MTKLYHTSKLKTALPRPPSFPCSPSLFPASHSSFHLSYYFKGGQDETDAVSSTASTVLDDDHAPQEHVASPAPVQLKSILKKPTRRDDPPPFYAQDRAIEPVRRTVLIEKFPEEKVKPRRFVFLFGRKLLLSHVLLWVASVLCGLLLILAFCVPRPVSIDVRMTSGEQVYTLAPRTSSNGTAPSNLALLIKLVVDLKSNNFYKMTAKSLNVQAYTVTNDNIDPIHFSIPDIVIPARSTRTIQTTFLLPMPHDSQVKNSLEMSFRCLANRIKVEYDVSAQFPYKTSSTSGQATVSCPAGKVVGGAIRAWFGRMERKIKSLI